MANNKRISVGIGTSKDKDSYKAAKEAAKQAMTECGDVPTFSIVYVDSSCNPKKVLKGINEVLGKNWVGLSIDKMFNSKTDYDADLQVSVLSINSKYLHFSTAVAENYLKNPIKKGFNAINSAIESVHGDTYIDSYIQFTRTKKNNYGNIIRTPPYFIFTTMSSQTKKNGQYLGGEESKFIDGIMECTGPHVPIFGLGAGYDFEKFLDQKVKNADSFQFANGKLYYQAGIIVFVISNLHFEISVQHGYSTTKDYVVITKLDKKGFEILELNGREPVAEYCRLIKAPKKDYLENPENFSLKRPFAIPGFEDTSYIKVAFPNPDGKTLHSTHRLQTNSVLNILKYNKKTLFSTMADMLSAAKLANKNKKKISISFFCNCCSRRLLMEGKEEKALKLVKAKHGAVPLFGAYAFAEIGSTKTSSAQVHGETVTSLIIYDKLLSED